MSTTAREVSSTRRVFAELNKARPLMDYHQPSSTPLHVENTAANSVAVQEGVTARTKHIEVRFHHVKFMLFKAVIGLLYVDSKAQIADLLTKPVDRRKIQALRPRLLREE